MHSRPALSITRPASAPFGMQVYAPRSTRIRVMNRVDDASGQTVAFTGSDFPYNRWIVLC